MTSTQAFNMCAQRPSLRQNKIGTTLPRTLPLSIPPRPAIKHGNPYGIEQQSALVTSMQAIHTEPTLLG